MGYDAGKQVKGRNIHAPIDSEGLPMRLAVHSAAIQDRDEAGLILDKIRRRCPRLELSWADGSYNAWQVEAAEQKYRGPHGDRQAERRHEGLCRSAASLGSNAPFSWFGRNRRLANNFENLAEILATFVTLASIQLSLRRLASA